MCVSDCPQVNSASNRRKQAINDPSTVIDVALVAGGENAARQVPVLVKSILYNRLFSQHYKQPRPKFCLHIICSTNACRSLSVLFDTWKIAGLTEINFYNVDEYETLVNWIPNVHYSGLYGLIKLVISDILPHKVNRVIILDLDTLVEGDLSNLWNAAEKFGADEIIGLIENQSDWYLTEHGTASWPALGYGYNTGVMLIDLKKMRTIGWGQHWKNVAKVFIKNASHTSLADQDIMNAALYFNSSRVLSLPCLWNLQLGDNANHTHCLHNDKNNNICPSKSISSIRTGLVSDVEILESDAAKGDNSVYIQQKKIIFSALNLRLQFALKMDHLANLDGTLYRERAILQTELSTWDNEGGTVKFCSLLRLELKLQRRTFPYYFGSNSNITGDVTLVSQLTLDRLHRLEEIAAYWEGPMSLAVYVSDREGAILAEYLESSTILFSRKNICIHLVFQEGIYYPINALRNVAIQYAETKYVFILDFDFIPSPGLYENFQNVLSTADKSTKNVAYIVPAFETFNSQLDFPSTKEDLLQRIASGVVKPFRIDVWQAGHWATNYSRWYTSDSAYEVQWDADFEPYILIRREYGQFDENFVGFGWNKVSFFMLLDALNFKFVVLPDAFIIHLPHPPSIESNRFRHSGALRQCLEELKVKYVKDLAARFGVKSLKYLRFRHRTLK
ncbi:hypothetical protein Aperf_G00000030884 [Anoplocephala perfoliata]